MSQLNAEIVRLTYEAVSRHGPEAGTGFAGNGVEVVDRLEAGATPAIGTAGLAEVYAAPQRYFDPLTVEPTELIDAGDAVVACLRIGGTSRANGTESWTRAFHVHWLRDGLTVRLEVCADRAAALRAAATRRPGPISPASPKQDPGAGPEAARAS